MADKGILLLSGGIDSPVAGLLTKRYDIELIGLHCSNEKYTDSTPREKCIQLAPKIGLKKLHIIEISPILELFSKTSQSHHYYFILMKRLFLKLAEKVAQLEKASLIVTGESMGQVSSQTLSCLTVIDKATTLPVIRPLLSLSKDQIVEFAKKFDTFETSTGPEFCDILGPKHPKTRADLEHVLQIEQQFHNTIEIFMKNAFASQHVETVTVNKHKLITIKHGEHNSLIWKTPAK